MRCLGLDLGSRTLGIAISDSLGLVATAYETIKHDEDYDKLLLEVSDIVEKERIDAIVLGFPKNMNNTIGPKGILSIEFQKKIQKKLSIPVYLQDERLSTKQAENVLIKANTSRKKRKKVIDKMAATIILQSFLDKKGNKL